MPTCLKRLFRAYTYEQFALQKYRALSNSTMALEMSEEKIGQLYTSFQKQIQICYCFYRVVGPTRQETELVQF